MRIFNTFVSRTKVFISSAKGIHLNHQKCSSPAQNALIASNKHVRLQCDLYMCIWRWVAKTISLLVMNAFICSVKSYLEVSSRDYLVASNAFVFYLEIGLVNPPKRTETRGKSFWKNFDPSKEGPVKSTETRQGWKNSRTLPYYKMVAPSSQASKAMHLHPYIVHFEPTKWTSDASALEARKEAAIILQWGNVVGFFSSLPCSCTFLLVYPYLKWTFLQKLFPLVEYCYYTNWRAWLNDCQLVSWCITWKLQMNGCSLRSSKC